MLTSTPSVLAQVAPPGLSETQAFRSIALPRALQQAEAVYRPWEIIHLYQQELNWINETRTVNDFAGGQLVGQHTYTWVGEVIGEWSETGRTDHTYSSGRLVRSTDYEAAEANLLPVTRTSYTYQGPQGYPGYSEVLTEVFEDGAWANAERTTFSISEGVTTGGLTEMWSGTDWEPSEQVTLTEEVEAMGNVSSVFETYQAWVGGAWVDTERMIYHNQTIAELSVWLERFAAEVSDYEGMYFSMRGFPNFTAQEWDGSAWVNVSRWRNEFTYQIPDGYLLKQESTTEEWADDAWVPVSRIVVDYVRASTPVVPVYPSLTSFEFFDGTSWTPFFTEKYIIQTDIGRIVQATVEADLGAGIQETSRVRIEWTAVATAEEPEEQVVRFGLLPNAPNPFTESTAILYRLPEPQVVRLVVYDLLGREVALLAEGLQSAGEHRLRWGPANAPSGVYLLSLEAGGRVETRRMVLLR